ncbi:hypothetical protein CCAX7_37170 [Capsulimonas corticalis]|uniref:DNA mimic protein DMP19 C-terminal domain-containing protein n=1 Tax=Capsulimonas corticalis TaxID=2219043 RepID=A0A402D153_9BACT|nr:DUF4375 domain-containing protein [Capsulimonas corticalis]BDI31666.1 hypothetical protein CCAX7_37170 [Capsulimonas corticalis]
MTITDIVEFVMMRGGDGRFGALNRAQRVVYAISDVDSMTAEYSLYDYYDSNSGKNAAFVVSALKEIGALESSAVIRSANALFPGGQPALDLGQRRNQIEAMGEDVAASIKEIGDQFMNCTDNFAEKFEAFVLANQKDLMAQ